MLIHTLSHILAADVCVTLLQISTCADLTSSSCELTADGVGSLQNFTQLSDSSYEIGVQVQPA